MGPLILSKGLATKDVVLQKLSTLEEDLPLCHLINFNEFNKQAKIFLAEVDVITNWVTTRFGIELLDKRSELFYAIHEFLEEISHSLKIEPKSSRKSRRQYSENAKQASGNISKSVRSSNNAISEELQIDKLEPICPSTSLDGEDFDPLTFVAVKTEPDEFSLAEKNDNNSDYGYLGFDNDIEDLDDDFAVKHEPDKSDGSNTSEEDNVFHLPIEQFPSSRRSINKIVDDGTNDSGDKVAIDNEATKSTSKIPPKELTTIKQVKYTDFKNSEDDALSDSSNSSTFSDKDYKPSSRKWEWDAKSITITKKDASKCKPEMSSRERRLFLRNKRIRKLTKSLEASKQREDTISNSKAVKNNENENDVVELEPTEGLEVKVGNERKWVDRLLVFNNYRYSFKSKTDIIQRYVCTNKYKQKCNAYLNLNKDLTAVLEQIGQHNHIHEEGETSESEIDIERLSENDQKLENSCDHISKTCDIDDRKTDTDAKIDNDTSVKDVQTSIADGEMIISNPRGNIKFIKKKVWTKPTATFKGNIYHFSFKSRQYQRFYCTKRRKQKCKAEIELSLNLKTVLKEIGEHSHQAFQRKQRKPKKYTRKTVPTTPMICDQCGKVILCKGKCTSALIKHKMIHNDERNYECKECGNSYRTINGLNEHMVRHSGIKPYVCQYCGRAFSFRGSHRRHEKSHGERAFCCTYENCDKRFFFKPQLIMHIRVHTDERPFKCNTCEKTFRRYDALYLHKRIHLGLSSRPYHKKKPRNQIKTVPNSQSSESQQLSSNITASGQEELRLLSVSQQSLSKNSSMSTGVPNASSFLVVNTLKPVGRQGYSSSSSQLQISNPNPTASLFVYPHCVEAQYDSFSHFPHMKL